jgi:ribosomal protein L12E/L44/L45/RPP1/RPP2
MLVLGEDGVDVDDIVLESNEILGIITGETSVHRAYEARRESQAAKKKERKNKKKQKKKKKKNLPSITEAGFRDS